MKNVLSKINTYIHSIINNIVSFFTRFIKGNLKTKLSYIIMGSGMFLNGQIVKGLIFLSIQVSYIQYMVNKGIYYLQMLTTLGTKTQGEVWDESLQIFQIQQGDNSMLLLLFGVSTVLLSIIIFGIYVWNTNIAYRNEMTIKNNKKPDSFRHEVKELFNTKFHFTVLSIPVVLTFLFTIVPLIFMILMAFTNYNRDHQPPGNLFTWVGFNNFSQVLFDNPLWSETFSRLFIWTIVWAIFATFLNYILGMLLAILINSKGIKLKTMWRTIFVITIAVPQFVSLLLMSKLLADTGALNNLLINLGIIDQHIGFLSNGDIAKVVVIVINLWVGVPYTMLITSGILMNIPQDLYEASKIDGASPFKQFMHITLPYMLHVTTPYLITQFIGNINNFNVIFLLTGGGPLSLNLYQAGETDLLVTWLYKLTVNEQNYALASTIGIIIFVVLAFISLVAYNKSSSVQNEEDFK